MAIAPIDFGDKQTRAKINAAIQKANLVDGKADVSALAAETAARQDVDATLQQDKAHRLVAADAGIAPGDAPPLWTGALDDTSQNPPPIDASLFVSDSEGRVLRAAGAQTVACIALHRIEPGREYHVRFAARRRTNSPDPANDGVRFAVRWFDQALTPIGSTVLADLTDVTTGSGRQTLGRVVARQAGARVDHVAPAGARYARPFVQTFGLGAATDIEIIDIVDVTDATLWSPDVSDLDGRLTEVESIDAGNRLDYLEAVANAPEAMTLANIGTLEATAIPAGVQSVTLLSGPADGDGRGGTYRRSGSPTPVQSLDGAYWSEVNPLLLPSDEPTAIAGVDTRRGMTAFLTRASIVANAKDGTWAQDGAGAVSSSILESLRTIEVTPEQFGAKNDRATPDDDAFDAAYVFLMSLPQGGTLRLKTGLGYLLNRSHHLWPAKAYALRWEAGAYVYYGPDMAGDAAKILLDFDHPTGDDIYGKYMVWDAPRILPWDDGASGQTGPVLFQYRRMGQTHLLQGGEVFTSRNTAFRLSRIYNSKFDKCVIFGGGHHLARKISLGTFTIAAGTKNITSSLGEFDGSDVGRQVFLYGSRTQQFTIASVTDASSAVTTENAVATFTAARGNFDGIKCETTAGSDIVTLEAGRTTADLLGRVVKIVDAATEGGAGDPRHPHRATVAEIVSATQIRLDAAPTVSQASTYISFSPVVDIYPEAEGGTNDFIWDNLTIEADHGTLLAVDKAINVRFPNLKIHADNPGFFAFGYEDDCTLFNMMLSRTTGYFAGDIEGAVVNGLGRVHVSGVTGLLSIGDVTGIGCDWQSLVYKSDCVSGAEVVVGNWTLNNVVGYQTIDRALMGKGSGRISLDRGALVKSAYTGTYHPRRFGVMPYDVTLAPTGAEMVAAGTGTLLGISGSEINWLAFGTSALAPTNAADFSNGLRLVSRAYAPNGTQVQNALLQVRNRNPSVGNVEGEWLIQTRDSGGTLTTRWQIAAAGHLYPGADNAYDIGFAGSGRVRNVYLGNNPIVTSDERDKQDIADIPDAVLDAWGTVRRRKFRYHDAVEIKGDGARWHFGLVAQEVIAALEAEGIDPFRLGPVCLDSWDAEPPRPAVMQTVAVQNEHSTTTAEAIEVEPAFPGREAGERYGLRYTECDQIEAAWQRREKARQAERIAHLEERLALLEAGS